MNEKGRIKSVYDQVDRKRADIISNVELSEKFCGELGSFFRLHYEDNGMRPKIIGDKFNDNSIEARYLDVVTPISDKNREETHVRIGQFFRRIYEESFQTPVYYEIDVEGLDHISRFTDKGSIMESREKKKIPFETIKFGGPPVYVDPVWERLLKPDEIEMYGDLIKDLTSRSDIQYKSK